MSRVRDVVLPLVVALFVACAAPAGAAVNPTAVKEMLALLNELGYVAGASTTSIDHDTDTALTLFFKAENPPELAGIKFGPGVWDNNLDKCLEALRNALQRARDDQTKPHVVIETPHDESSVHIAADRAGKSVISIDASMIKSWDIKTGRQRWSQLVPSVVADRVSDGTISVTDDGRYAIIGSIAFRVYEIATGKVVKTFWDRVNRFNTLYPVAALAARPGTSELIVAEGTALEKLVVFDWKTGRFLGEIGHENSISLNMALSADGRYAATTSWDAGIRIWDLSRRRLLRSLTLPGGLKFQHPVFFNDGRTLAVLGTYDLNKKDRSSTLSIFDIERGHIATREFSYVDYSHYSSAVDENVIYLNGTENKGDDTETLVIDSRGRTARKLPQLNAHDLVVGSPPIGFGMAQGRLAASSFDNKEVWPGGQEVIGFSGFVRDADRSSDAMNGLGHDLFKLDLATGAIEPTGKFESQEHSYSRLKGLQHASDGRLVGGFFDDGTGQVQDSDGKMICKIEVKSKPSDEIVVIDTFDHSKAVGLIALWVDSSVALFDDRTCQEQRRIPVEFAGRAHALSIMGVQPFPAGFRFSGDGETLYVWRADTAVQAFDPRTGRRLAVYRTDFDNGQAPDDLTAAFRSATSAGLSPLVHKVLPVPNSKRFMAVITANAYTRNGYKGGLVLLFEEGNPRWTAAFRFSQNLDKWAIDPSGTRLVADLREFGVQVADFATGRAIAGFGAQPANIQEIAFSPDARHVLILSGDGVLRIFSATTGALLVTSTAGSDGSWLTITPEGFFAGSPGGGKLVRIRRGDTTFDIDQAYQALYRPDLVREKLSGDTRGLVSDAAARLDLDRVLAGGLAPVVSIVSPAAGTGADTINAEVEITARDGGIGRVEWRVNGVTVGVETPAPSAAGVSLRLTRGLSLDPGDNVIEVVAYNEQNLVASTPARATVAGPARAVLVTAARLFVLAVGVDDYVDANIRLKLAVADAQTLSEALVQSGRGFYSSVEVTLLRDAEVRRERLDAAFAALAAKVQPTDTFVFFLAGHGKTIDGRYYFMPQNTTLETVRTLMTAGGADARPSAEAELRTVVTKQGIAQEQWQTWFASIAARKSVLLFDTCESGSLTEDGRETRTLERDAANGRLAQATGRTIITAASDDQEANEGYRGHGLFTYQVLEALERGDSDRNGTIEVAELAAYVYAEVSALSEQVFRARQVPQVRIAGDYPLTNQATVLGGIESGLRIPTKPTHILGTASELLIQPQFGAAAVRKLDTNTPVTMVKSEAGWTLVAVGGRPIGYVNGRALAPMQ